MNRTGPPTTQSLDILLISTYEMGRQPFGLASPAAWLRETGARVRCVDMAVDSFPADAAASADLIGFYVPMHTATRMAVQALERIRALNPTAHIVFFGLYASENAAYLRSLGVDTVLGGEFETGLVALAEGLAQPTLKGSSLLSLPSISLARQQFRVPDRRGLPPLHRYAHLMRPDGREVLVGYVEATRGCLHLCRHCPIVPVYNGRFRVVQPDVVLADIRQQVQAGAEHITFGDPDFFNGPTHAERLVTALHAEFPTLTYDVTIKVEHLIRHATLLPGLRATGCLFITSAVEAFDEAILAIFDKRHTAADVETAVSLCRAAGIPLIPTFVAFTPWTTLDGYRAFLSEIVRLNLVDHVAPIQYAIRLLIPPGSRLLDLPDVRAIVGDLDPARLSYTWRNSDPRVDALQRDLEALAQRASARHLSRQHVFRKVWDRAHRVDQDALAPPPLSLPPTSAPLPYLTEPWYC